MTRYMPKSKKDREFRKCYAEHYPVILAFLASRVGSMDDAEDICQEVFIRLYGNLEKVRERRSWLLTAARFEITNYFNKKATARSDAADIDDFNDDPRLTTQDSFAENRIIIRDVIDDPANYQDERERLLFDLVAIYQFTYKEAGKYLDLTRWQAEYKYRQIEKRILARLNEKGIRELGDML
jgi:RNA polymerase sigma-70 factor, ECF subfamily